MLLILKVIICLIFKAYCGSPKDDVEVISEDVIIRNVNAYPNQHPFMASVHWKRLNFNYGFHICSGAIISFNFVVSPANCQRSEGEYFVVAGAINIIELNAGNQLKKVEEIITHPFFQGQYLFAYDIALLRVEHFSWTSSVRPIKFPGNALSSNITLVGWGRNSYGIRSKMQHIKRTLMTSDVCFEYFPSHVGFSKIYNLCTEVSLNDSPCLDGAGEALVENGYLLGISTWVAFRCGIFGPTVFINIEPFTDWINYHIGK